MPRGKPHDLHKFTTVIVMYCMKKTIRQISLETGVSQSSIYTFLRRFKNQRRIRYYSDRLMFRPMLIVSCFRILSSSERQFPVFPAAYLKANGTAMSEKLKLIRVSSPSFTIGRAQYNENGLSLMDISISRKHCEFMFIGPDGGWTVTDFSSNGVFLNDKMIPKMIATPINSGDSIVLSENRTSFNWTFVLGEPSDAETQVLD